MFAVDTTHPYALHNETKPSQGWRGIPLVRQSWKFCPLSRGGRVLQKTASECVLWLHNVMTQAELSVLGTVHSG